MTWTTRDYKHKQLVTGEYLSLKTYTLSGKHDGPHVHIQASVHGAELQGNAVILTLIDILKRYEIHGSITFVPLCNSYASNLKIGAYTYGRFNPVTGHNWNRNFIDVIGEYTKAELSVFAREFCESPWAVIKSAFKKFLLEHIEKTEELLIRTRKLNENNNLTILLQKLASSADIILDLHTGPLATRYLYAAHYEQKLVKYLLFDHVIVIPPLFAGAMDEASFMPWLYLCEELSRLGREIEPDIYAFTLELGSEESFSMSDAKNDADKILNFLAACGVIDIPVRQSLYKFCALKDFSTIYAPCGGLCDYVLSPGTSFKARDIVAFIYTFDSLDPNNMLCSRKAVLAPADGIVINRCASSAVHQGMELLQVMLNVQIA